jgi:hypothetical protein
MHRRKSCKAKIYMTTFHASFLLILISVLQSIIKHNSEVLCIISSYFVELVATLILHCYFSGSDNVYEYKCI